MARIDITPTLSIDEDELELSFVRAGGPGGQNVNKVATAVQLRFDVGRSSLPAGVRARLTRAAGKRLTADGVVIIQAQRFRTQERNRADAIERLAELIRSVATPPRPRRPTKPSRSARAERMDEKARRGGIKRVRGRVRPDHD